MENLHYIKELQKGIIAWYDFSIGSNILYIGDNKDAIADYLIEKSGAAHGKSEERGNFFLNVTIALPSYILSSQFVDERLGAFDYIISIACLEKEQEIVKILYNCKKMLKESGVLLLGLNNRLGLRYFCGDRDPYTERNFDSIENYRQSHITIDNKFKGRMYAKDELKRFLYSAGFMHSKFFAVLPDLDNPFLIYADDFLPTENLANRLLPTYNYADTVFLNEKYLYQSLINNNIFHQLANSFFIECPIDGRFSNILHITCSIERGREDSLFTIIYENFVEKKAIFTEGQSRLQNLAQNHKDLAGNGLNVIKGEMKDHGYVMPRINAISGQNFLRNLLLKDREKFLAAIDQFRDLILKSSPIVSDDSGDGWGTTLSSGYLDLVPLNSFYIDGKFVFFDQEFCYPNFPANMIVYRMIVSFYWGNDELEQIVSRHDLFERYGLNHKLDIWKTMDEEFICNLRNFELLADYHKKHWPNDACTAANRNRMNYSQLTYDKHIRTMLDKANTRKLILFGSGKYAKSFLLQFGHDYPVYAIVDNNEKRHGERLEGIVIHPVDILSDLSVGEYKIIICVKDYKPIAEQLENMRIFFYGIYNPAFSYSFNHRLQDKEKTNPKKFHIGYVAGVFDLFHIGHLNILRRAKEQCDYLIVGVVSDRQVREGKKVEPFVPFEERLEMVKSCRYVDEAHEIPFEHPDTDMAWKLYHFDVQFSGSDYEHDPVWLAKKKWLEERGSTLVFFPYTQSTSSTHLKKLIEKRLL